MTSLTILKKFTFGTIKNKEEDKLATAFQERSIHGTGLGPLIPGSRYQVVIENQIIPNNHRHRIRTRRGREKLMNYIREKLQNLLMHSHKLIGRATPRPLAQNQLQIATDVFQSTNQSTDIILLLFSAIVPAAYSQLRTSITWSAV
jgi:hypothetical protein